jgi:hypothetical protein
VEPEGGLIARRRLDNPHDRCQVDLNCPKSPSSRHGSTPRHPRANVSEMRSVANFSRKTTASDHFYRAAMGISRPRVTRARSL